MRMDTEAAQFSRETTTAYVFHRMIKGAATDIFRCAPKDVLISTPPRFLLGSDGCSPALRPCRFEAQSSPATGEPC
jgi:hypothetical protein